MEQPTFSWEEPPANPSALPDDHAAIAWRGKPAERCPDSPRYKAVGNSMVVSVLRWIGRRVQMVEEVLNETAPAHP